MFERPHHQRIAHVLSLLDGELLRAHGCYFGGGTCIALQHGEYRQSVDMDFLVSDAAGYRELRLLLTSKPGLSAIMRSPEFPLVSKRDMRADQYGIRTELSVDGHGIKFEIVREARIALDVPGPADVLCGVSTLTACDLAASKMLANSDRHADDGVYSRDLIDLAMMELRLPMLRKALNKAELAYGAAVLRDLARAIDRMQERTAWLERCLQVMAMTMAPAILWQRIRALRRLLPPA